MRTALLFTVVLATLAAWVSASGHPNPGSRQSDGTDIIYNRDHGIGKSARQLQIISPFPVASAPLLNLGGQSIHGTGPLYLPRRRDYLLDPLYSDWPGLSPSQNLCREHKWFGIWANGGKRTSGLDQPRLESWRDWVDTNLAPERY
ncbi:hypothetical protein GE061_018773 [Apolygus lucorum]|uniref:Uncharacterized protein n=1 Tax=Apolygus lucorum TaxID=248454 RepID=A0A6A4JQH0_APOLU|nr:hypothetical protein GE061_018773 [Apolygus lucorum]